MKLSLVGSVSFLSCVCVNAVFKEGFVATEVRGRPVERSDIESLPFLPSDPPISPSPSFFAYKVKKSSLLGRVETVWAGGLAEVTLQECGTECLLLGAQCRYFSFTNNLPSEWGPRFHNWWWWSNTHERQAENWDPLFSRGRLWTWPSVLCFSTTVYLPQLLTVCVSKKRPCEEKRKKWFRASASLRLSFLICSMGRRVLPFLHREVKLWGCNKIRNVKNVFQVQNVLENMMHDCLGKTQHVEMICLGLRHHRPFCKPWARTWALCEFP